MRRPAAFVAVAIAVLAACGGGDGASDESTGSPPLASRSAGSATTAVPASATEGTEAVATDATRPTATPSTRPPTIPPTTPAAPSTSVEGVVPGTATITLLTEGSGLGARPLLTWEPIAEAASYVVSVNAEGGGPLWAWQGATTEVPFGGGSVDDPDTTGAQLTGPATWFVAALDADGRVLATSVPTSLAP